MAQLTGKTVIVTGSSRGVGADTAQILAAEGANVVVNYRSKAPRAAKIVTSIEEAGGKAIAVQADVTNTADLQNLVQTAVDTYGSLDYLVLNASGGMESGMGEDYAMRLNRDAQLELARLAAQKNACGRAYRVCYQPPGTLHPGSSDHGRIPAGRRVKTGGGGRPRRRNPGTCAERHLPRYCLCRHD